MNTDRINGRGHRWNGRRRSMLAIVCIVLFVCMFSVVSYASKDSVTDMPTAPQVERQNIRIGFFESDGYHQIDARGVMSGYGYDFLQMLLRYNDWSYDYIGYDKNWGDMMTMLDQGEIDLVTLADKTPEREEKYVYSAMPIGSSSTIMTMNAANTEITIGDYATYDGRKIGLVKGSSHNEDFEVYAAQKGFTFQQVYYENIDEMLADLRAGQNIDIAVTSNMRQAVDEIILDEFDVTDYYAIARKGNEALIEKLDEAVELLDVYSADWRDKLFNKYYSNINDNAIALSVEERAYIQKLKDTNTTIKAVLNPELKPYSYFEDGEAKGIAVEIFKEIARRTDLNYEILPSKNRWEYKKQLQEGIADIDLTAYADYGIAQRYNLKETDAYMTTSLAMIFRGNSNLNPDEMLVATLEDPTEYMGYNDELIYQYRYENYNSIRDCITAVKKGDADVYFIYSYMAEQAVAEDYSNRLKYSILQNTDFGLCIGVINQEDHRLLSILNKGVCSLSPAFTNKIMLEQSVILNTGHPLLIMIYGNPWLVILVVAALLFLLFLLLLLSVQHRNQKKQLQASAEFEKVLEEKNQSLYEALDTAKQASSAKGLFVSKISHEIRTPLNAIIGYLNIASENPGDQTQVEHCLHNCINASVHLLDLINDVLDLSAIENSKMKIAHEVFDLKDMITGISNIYYSQAEQHHEKFHVDLVGLTEEKIIGDSLRVKQVLMNLLSNSIKFTGENGTIGFKIEQLTQDENQTHIRFTVSDDGIGMEQEYLSHIFDAFEQETASIARKYGGSGLGLSITKNLVDLMDGSISVTSVKNQGTTFTVVLAFGRCAQEQEQYSVSFHNVRVLLVENEKESADYIKSLLKRCHVKCDVVDSEEAAIKQIKIRKVSGYAYTICLLDDTCQELDCRSIAKQVITQDLKEHPEIVVITYDASEIREAADTVGVRKIIEKPLFQSTMVDLLTELTGYIKEKDAAPVLHPDILQGLHVLLAEDNEMNMEISTHILTKAGMIVEPAVDGREACETFLTAPSGTYRMILMDIQMPYMNGYEATRKIRMSDHPDAKKIPIIALTANAFSEDVSKALNAGMNDHISKPVNPEKLCKVLETIILKEEKENHE